MSQRISIERTFPDAALIDVWELWTTKDGIESWWGPEGFRVEVQSLDLRVAGQLRYQMICTNPEIIQFLESQKIPTVTDATITYREIVPQKRLAYDHLTDFVPDVAAYDVRHVVELFPQGDAVRMLLTFDAMHAPEWTERARMGWEQELGKLATALKQRPARAS